MADHLSLVARLAPDVSVQGVGDDVLAFDGERLTRLGGVAALVVRSVDGIRSLHTIAELASSATGPPLTEASAPVIQAVDWLVGRSILELGDRAPGPRYRRPDHVGACDDGDQVALIDVRTGQQIALSASGAEVWRLLVDAGSLDEAIAELELAYPDAPGLADDITEFVAGLVASGMLERLEPSG